MQRQLAKNKIDTSYLVWHSGEKREKQREKRQRERQKLSLQGERLRERPLFEVVFSFLLGSLDFLFLLYQDKRKEHDSKPGAPGETKLRQGWQRYPFAKNEQKI